jgi:hypothetical protein
MLRIVMLSVLAILVAASTSATVLLPTDLGELSRSAHSIARGRIVALEPHWTDKHRTVETIVTLEADAYLKGALGETVRFRVPGGELGRYRSIVVGAPQFAIGQLVVVFLGVRGASVPYVLGLSQGVFRLVRDSEGGWLVTPSVILPETGGLARSVRGDVARRSMALADFERRVQALAGAAR